MDYGFGFGTILLLITYLSLTVTATAKSCTTVRYDSATQLCCHGHIYQRRSDVDYRCCGTNIYSPKTQNCCGDELRDKEDPLLCCNRETYYDQSSQICCQGNLLPKTDGVGCCGGRQYNPLSETCCYNGANWAPVLGLGKCCGGNKVYDPTTELCCTPSPYASDSVVHPSNIEDIESGDVKCCGLNPYNVREQHCCKYQGDNEVVTKGNFTSCCGTDVIDERNQICCSPRGNPSPQPLTEGKTECCWSWTGSTYTPYNPANEQCCGGHVREGKGGCCWGQPYDTNSASCCRGVLDATIPMISGVQDCCGTTSYLKTNQVCCDGSHLHPWQPNTLCCGNDTYNNETHLCCGSQILPKQTPTSKCCGRDTSYDPTTQTCCPLHRQGYDIAGGACCKVNKTHEVAYNPETQTCCSVGQTGAVHDGGYQGAQCCGSHLMNITNQLCDISNLQPVTKDHPEDNEVCWPINEINGRAITGNDISVHTYDSTNKACTVQGNVIGKQPWEEFCGHSLYNNNTELCCGWQIHEKQDLYGNVKKCCDGGADAYVPEYLSCVAGRVFNIPEADAGYCHGIAYSQTTHDCDINGVVRLKQEVLDKPDLCGNPSSSRITWPAYNKNGQTCCLGAIFDTPGTSEGKCCAGIAYNPSEHICCGEKLTELAGRDMECCSNRVYDTNGNHKCCGARLQSSAGGRTQCTNGVIHRPEETVCETVRYDVSDGVCCGKQLLDVNTQLCCQDIVYNKNTDTSACCGNVQYDAGDASKKCCDGSLHSNAADLTCCGSSAIDNTTQQCCGQDQYQFIYSNGAQSSNPVCCQEGNYDSTQHKCCGGLLHKNIQNAQNAKCCGYGLVRDDRNEMCCGGSVKPKKYGADSGCCGDKIIDNRRFECCGGKSMFRGGWNQCCNNQIRPFHHTCDEIQSSDSSPSQGYTKALIQPEDKNMSGHGSTSTKYPGFLLLAFIIISVLCTIIVLCRINKRQRNQVNPNYLRTSSYDVDAPVTSV